MLLYKPEPNWFSDFMEKCCPAAAGCCTTITSSSSTKFYVPPPKAITSIYIIDFGVAVDMVPYPSEFPKVSEGGGRKSIGGTLCFLNSSSMQQGGHKKD